mmetsp:Transcript_69380/g.176204  ORF Transcript_69380/g.176204 Transcript_69380/m.176204 type:complete len:184 (-) Transcript_69380:50-601(-)
MAGGWDSAQAEPPLVSEAVQNGEAQELVVSDIERRRLVSKQEAILHTVHQNLDIQVGVTLSGVTSSVLVDLGGGQQELVVVDEIGGPKVDSENEEGKWVEFRTAINAPWDVRSKQNRFGISWTEMTSTQRKVVLEMVAKYNRSLRANGRFPSSRTGAAPNPNPYGRMLAAKRAQTERKPLKPS